MVDNINEIKKIQEIELDMLIDMKRVCEENNLEYYLAYGTALGAIRHEGFIPWDSDLDIIVMIDEYDRFCDILNKEMSEKYFINSIKTDSEYEELFARIGVKERRHHTIHIDIFPMVGTPVNKVARKLFIKLCHINYRSYFIKKVKVDVNYKNRPKRKKQAMLAKLILFPFPAKFFIWLYSKLSRLYSIDESEILYNICGSYGEKELIPKYYLGTPEYKRFESHEFPLPNEWDKYLTHIYGDYMVPKKENYV